MTKKILLMAACILALVFVLTACGEESSSKASESGNAGSSETNAGSSGDSSTVSADEAIVDVTAIGHVDYDGAKVSAIAVEYDVDLDGADVTLDDYEITDYGILNANKCEIGENPGEAVKVYVNDEPNVSESGGSGTGNYVIIEVNTDYQLASSDSYNVMLAVDVKQKEDIKTSDLTITAGDEVCANYEGVEETTMMGDVEVKNYVVDGKYVLEGLERFEVHTIDGTGDLAPFEATNCFDEATGEYSDVTVPYTIYVPDDYDPNEKYALAMYIGAAGCATNDPYVTLTDSMTALDLSSDECQQMVKDHGLAGLICVYPQVPEDLRSTRDNWTTSAAVPAHWQFLDYITDTYSIDMDHIYATGHSMGGMQILEMAAQRDNYFAGIWSVGCQWGNNYNKEELYEDEVYYASPADGELIWTVDSDGNPCDYQNWFYMVSDDNILITNCAGDAFSSGTWQELAYLYSDLCNVEFPKTYINPLTSTDEELDNALNDLLAMDSDNGFYWLAFDGGSHTSTWVYSEHMKAGYEWLFSQTRETELNRTKLDLDKPFVWADDQIRTEERELWVDEEDPDNIIYYATGEYGSGTSDYNSPVYIHSGTPAKDPGWKAEY